MDEVSIEGAEVVPKKFTGVSKKPIILLCVVGLVLAPIAVYDDNWLNANIDTDDFWGTIMKQNVYISLDTFQMEYCADDDCEIEEKQKLGELYQICYDEVIEEEGDDEVDDDMLTVKWVLESSQLAIEGASNTFYVGFSTAGVTKTAYLSYGLRSTHSVSHPPFILKATSLPSSIYTG